jgi:hypothetical protein
MFVKIMHYQQIQARQARFFKALFLQVFLFFLANISMKPLAMRLLFLVTSLITCFFCFSQNPFQDISFGEALKKSLQEGKLIFIQYESAGCNQCNEVANKGLENEELAQQLAETFICLRITPEHKDREEIGNLYNIASGFGSLFIDQNKALIHSYRKTTSRAVEYKQQIDIALTKAGEGSRVNELEKEYKNGNRAIGFLEFYLQKRATLNLPNDDLLDEYVSLLPEDSLRSTRTLSFIAQLTPVLESKADRALRKDRLIFSRAWYNMPTLQRSKINAGIIVKSRRKAILEKDEAYALRVAAFARSTYTSNYQAGDKAFEANMLEFYKETKDTSTYFRKAIGYYDRYYMSVSVDSIRRMDSMTRRRLLANTPPSASFMRGDTMVRTKTISVSPATQFFSRDLNNGASDFYTRTNNAYLLSIATEWVKKGLDFFETPEALDTYSRLLYKQGQKQAAIDIQQKAIALRKQRGFPVKEFELILEKMKRNDAVID